MDSTNLVMEAARLLDESLRDDDGSADFADTSNQDDGFGLGEESREPHEIKQDIKCLLKRRFGRKSKRLIKAVDRCGNSVEELFDLTGRLEKYVRVFLDNHASHSVGAEIRELISGTSSSSC
jgi:hypothetical protein